MPTTQPLDDDLGGIIEGQLKPIAEFANPGTETAAAAPRAKVPHVSAAAPSAESRQNQASTSTATSPSHSASTSPGFRGRRMTNLHRPAMSLSGASENSLPKTPEKRTVAAGVKREAPYIDADILNAWQQFIDLNKPEHLLVNAMRVAVPDRLADHNYRVAQSSIHLNYIAENLARITAFVRDKVGNDNVAFTLQEVSAESPLVWNERELLQHIVEENPGVGKFISSLHLKLM